MTDSSSSRFSRRAFLKGASAAVAASGGAVGAHAAASAGSDAGASDARGSATTLAKEDLHEVTLQINGQSHSLKVETRTTLLDAMRDQLGLTGTKKVCDRGACGACTVILDGETANSCMTLALDAEGTSIRTIEGLAGSGSETQAPELHPMQQAFVDCDALQCGFCTPGMVMSAVACVDRRSGKPTDTEMREDMAGNICRCGTYTRVFEAIQQAAASGGGTK